jgi:hypothetical protein
MPHFWQNLPDSQPRLAMTTTQSSTPQIGFEVLALNYLFIFPKALRAFRFLQVLCRKIS